MRPCDERDFNATLRLSLAREQLAPAIYEAMGTMGYLTQPSVLWHDLTHEGREQFRDIAMAVLYTQRGSGSEAPYKRVEAERARQHTATYITGLHRSDGVIGQILPEEAAK